MPVLPGYSVSSRSDQFTEQRNLSDDDNSIVGSDGLHTHTTKKKKGTCGRLDRLVYVPMRRQSKGELTGHWKAMAGEQRGAGDDRVIDDGAEESLPSRGDDVQSERGRIGGESGRLNRARAGGRKEKKEGVDDREFRCVHTHAYIHVMCVRWPPIPIDSVSLARLVFLASARWKFNRWTRRGAPTRLRARDGLGRRSVLAQSFFSYANQWLLRRTVVFLAH